MTHLIKDRSFTELSLMFTSNWSKEFSFKVVSITGVIENEGFKTTEVLEIRKNGNLVALAYRYSLIKNTNDDYHLMSHETHGAFFIRKTEREELLKW